jgi:hypothetical protein
LHIHKAFRAEFVTSLLIAVFVFADGARSYQ